MQPLLPVLREVDVLVVGAGEAAVAAALEVQRQGRRALVVSDLSYFGEDSAGTLTCAPEFPGAVKRRLEAALLAADIPFLYLVRPVSLLRDGDARLAGAVLAARTSLFAVACGAIVDASRYRVVSRLAGARAVPRQQELPATVDWNVIAKEPLAGAADTGAAFGEYRVFTLSLPRGSDPFSREHLVRASLLDGKVLITADLLQDVSDTEFLPEPDVYREVREIGYRRVKPPVPRRGPYRFAPAFLRQTAGAWDCSPAEFPVLGRYDVVVAGGGTGGAPAGIAAARHGAKTVVLELQHGLGGVGTIGLISSYWFGNRVGFTRELDEAVMKLDPGSRAKAGRHWSPEVKSAVYHRLLQDAGGTAWLGSYAFGVRMDGDRVAGVLVSTPLGAGLLEVDCVVDATGNADIAAAAGAPCRVIGAQHLATQGTGLSPRTNPGVRGQNSDHTFVDETDPAGITHVFANARAKFTDAFDTSPLVNSRERRQICGELEVSPLDILAQRTFPDTVVTAISNFDTHGFIIHPVFMVAVPDHEPLQAHVPFRCLLPPGVEGVLVTGLGMSAHRDALPVLRMQADVQNQGYAAGLAAALAGRGRLRDLNVRDLQRRLVAVGNLAPEVMAHPDSFPVPAAAIREAMADLGAAKHVALLFAHPSLSVPLLREDPRLEAAQILGLMGNPSAVAGLVKAVREAAWDQGWNYTGMGQFGACMSRLDVLILALARTRDAAGVPVIEEKIRQLDGNAPFSHCRAAGLAAALLPPLASALATLLQQPGVTGHTRLDSLAVVRSANPEMNETAARNLSLRELYLARGLFLAGDAEGLGRRILESYTMDLRGHYARHARAVLQSQPGDERLAELA